MPPTVRIVTDAPRARVVHAPTPRIVASQRGPRGPAGVAQGVEHVQSTPSAEWIVNHNFGFEPVVTVLSSGGIEVAANVVHMSKNQVRIYFATPQTGRARCV